MIDESHSYPRWAMCALLLGAVAGCNDDTQVGPVATHVSRSSTIALSDDRSHVAMVNPDDGTVSVFQTSDNTLTSSTKTGGRPSSIALAPDGKTAYVANRADGTVVRMTGIDGPSPGVDAMVAVGAEPVGVALSPSGKLLFVAEFAQSEVSVIDTATMTVKQTITVDRPKALLVTNNGDSKYDDETLAITQYFGTPVPGREVKDDGRIGHVQLVSLKDLSSVTDLAL